MRNQLYCHIPIRIKSNAESGFNFKPSYLFGSKVNLYANCNKSNNRWSNTYVNNQHTDINSDQILVRKVLDHQNDAFSIIISNTERLVAQIVCKMIYKAEDRKDIAQDVYLKVYHKLDSFRFQCKLSTWIGQIAYHTCLNYIEKRKLLFASELVKDGRSEMDVMEQLYEKGKHHMDNEAEQALFLQDRQDMIQEAIDILPVLYKTLIVLYHQEEMSYTDIASITGLPDGTVKNYIFRARKVMREYLLTYFKHEDL